MTLLELAAEIEKQFGKRVFGAFPYADCIKIEDKYGASFHYFMMDFDMFYFDVLGCASSTKRFLTMPDEEVRHFQQFVALPFFDEFPQYKAAQTDITPNNTPKLYVYMEQMEQMRSGMCLLLQRRLEGEV